MAVGDRVEAALDEIGLGRWQALVMVLSLLSSSIIPVQQIGSTALSAPVPFRCSYPDNIQAAIDVNKTRSVFLNGLFNNQTVEYPSKCLPEIDLMEFQYLPQPEVSKINLKQHSTGLPSCPFVEYDLSIFQSTIITEWDLVCEKSSLRPLFQMTYSIGAILGSAFCGQLSDWLGRKRTLQMGTILLVTTVLGTSIAPWYSVMIFLRILSGTGIILSLFPTVTLVSEISPSSYRTITAVVPGIIYFAFQSVFAGVAYSVPDWRKLLLLCNSPLILLVPVIFFIDESPRWLIQKGRTTEAVDLLKKAAIQNGITFTSSTASSLEKLSEMSKDIALEKFGGENNNNADSHGSLRMLLACFASPGMRIILIVTPLMWLLKRTLYMGIILNANNFTSSSTFVYLAFCGSMGVLGLIISIPLSIKLPRRVFIGGALFLSGGLLLLELSVPADYWLAKWTMVMISYCFVCGAFQVNYIYAAELFPTVIRTRGLTFTNFIGSIGEMTIPLVTDIVVQYKWWAASATFGCAGIVASIIFPLLPETKDKPMPETLQDVEDRYWNGFKGKEKDITVSKDTSKGQVAFQV